MVDHLVSIMGFAIKVAGADNDRHSHDDDVDDDGDSISGSF